MWNSNDLDIFINKIEKSLDTSKHFVPFFKKNMKIKYRGMHSFAQERLSLTQVYLIIKYFYDLVGDDKMFIPPTPGDKDIKPEHKYFEEAANFRKIIYDLNMNPDYKSTANRKTNATQISFKKITLLNCFKLGVLEKYLCDDDGYCEKVSGDVGTGNKKTYYSLSQKSIKLSKMSEFDAISELSRMMKKTLVNSDVELLYEILLDERIETYDISKIPLSIYAFTLNYWGFEYNCKEEVIESFFELWSNRKSWLPFLEEEIKKLSDNTRHLKKKDGKIDWGNWKNQVQTKFSFLAQTYQFEISDKDELIFKLKNMEKFIPGRSSKEKEEYFARNNILMEQRKKLKYELHHIVPISHADDAEELMQIDSWKNMVYISPNCHSQFPKRNNNIVFVMDSKEDKIIISDFAGEILVEIINNENSLYNKEHSKIVDEYNKKILRMDKD